MDEFWHDAIKEWTRAQDRPKRCVCIIQDEKEHVRIGGVARLFGMKAEKIQDSPYIERPTKHMILTGMYDDVISRALNRGIGIKKEQRPLHFGLLNNDCKWVTKGKSPALEGLKSMHRLGTYRADTGKPVNAPVLSMKKLFDLDHAVNVERYFTNTASGTKNAVPPHTAGIWQSLKEHSIKVWETAYKFEMESEIKEHICNAARLHDIGKAQPKFQEALLEDISPEEREKKRYTIWAKRPHGKPIRDTKHDLAGGLSRARHSEIEAYLICAHHGRYRTSIPNTTETIPKADLGQTVRTETYAFTASHYTEMFDHIYTQYGPFKLAYMEAMVRCADIISSREASRTDGYSARTPPCTV